MPELQVDIVPREERDDAAMIPRVPQPMSGAMAGKLHCIIRLYHPVRRPHGCKSHHKAATVCKCSEADDRCWAQ